MKELIEYVNLSDELFYEKLHRAQNETLCHEPKLMEAQLDKTLCKVTIAEINTEIYIREQELHGLATRPLLCLVSSKDEMFWVAVYRQNDEWLWAIVESNVQLMKFQGIKIGSRIVFQRRNIYNFITKAIEK